MIQKQTARFCRKISSLFLTLQVTLKAISSIGIVDAMPTYFHDETHRRLINPAPDGAG
jgi:hypothetical protein